MHIDEIIKNVLLNKASQEEQMWLQKWRNSSHQNKVYLDELIQTIHLVDDLKKYPTDILPQEAWDKWSVNNNNVKPYLNKKYWLWITISTFIIGLCMLTYAYIMSTPPLIHKSEAQETILLADGSQVILDQNSKIKELNEHSYYFEGKGFFDIKKQKSSVFSIETDLGTIRVLGTSFTLVVSKEYLDLILEEGHVQAILNGKVYDITPGQKLKYSQNEVNIISLSSVSDVNWYNKTIEFKDADIVSVLEHLSTFFDRTIEYPKDWVNNACLINTKFTTETIEQVLGELKVLVKLK